MIHLPEFLSAAAGALIAIIGIRVIIKSPEGSWKGLFAAASITFAGISAGSFLITRGVQPERVLPGISLMMIFISLATALVVAYFRTMGKEDLSDRDRVFVLSAVGAGVIFSVSLIFLPASVFISRIHFMRESGGIFWGFTVSGWGKAGATLILLSNVYALHRIENVFRSSNIPGKVALKYPLLGVITASLINFTVFSRLIAVSILNRTHFAVLNCGTIILAVTWLYAFIRYQPLRITVSSSREQSCFSVTLTGLYLISLSIISYISSILDIAFDSFTVLLLTLFGAFLVIAAAISGKTRRRIRRFISDNFQTDRYNYRKEWNRYSRIMSRRDSVEDLLQNSIGSICESMLISRGCICTELSGVETAHYGEAPGSECAETLLRFASQSDRAESITFFNNSGASDALKEFSESGSGGEAEWIRALAILRNNDQTLGVIALGQKDTRARFVEEDRNFLSTISEELALALENILLSERIIEADRIESFNRFASFVIHDLKNTLGMLSLTAENARDNIADPRFQKDAINVLQRAVEKINHLISSLSAHRSPPTLSRKNINICDFLHEQEGMLQGIADTGDISLRIICSESLTANADPEALEKILENLMLNSVEASEKGSEVTVSARSSGEGMIAVSVSDRGEGFSREYFNNELFKPFRSTKKNGLGIGLVMCKTLAEAHNGTIMVENRSSGGALVTLKIPEGEAGQ